MQHFDDAGILFLFYKGGERMTLGLRTYLLSVCAAALFCATAMALLPKGSVRRVAGFTCGLLLTVAAIGPLTNLGDYSISEALAALQMQAEEQKAGVTIKNRELVSQIIKEKTQSYILDKAAGLDMDLMQTPHLAWHLSGGTTELLLVEPEIHNVRAVKIGGTSDISAGQLIDRTGHLLKLDFPSGKLLDRLCGESHTADFFRVKSDGLTFSFSGVQNKVEQYFAAGHSPEDTARYCLHSVCAAVIKTTGLALKQYPGFCVVFSGGVASNTLLRESCSGFESVFAPPQYSTDNAMGAAVLTWLQGE